MEVTLTSEERKKLVDEIAAAVADRLTKVPRVDVVNLAEAMRRTGFKSDSGFHRWAPRVGLYSLRGAIGRYSVASINQAIERASRPGGRSR